MNTGSHHNYASLSMQQALGIARLAAQSASVLLLQGESGSGKDFLARYVHAESRRSNGPYFSINCAALPHDLAETELFGHEEGAFTGAHGQKRGLIELAEGGTLLLNEIGELSLPLQAKLLTFLDTRQFLRVGGQSYVEANARIIAATNRDLPRMVAEGDFRGDLFHRLNVITLHVPALRERLEDLPGLAEELLAEVMKSTGGAMTAELHQETFQAMARYSWPGNIRELRNVLERCLVLSGSPTEEMNALLVQEIRNRRQSEGGAVAASEDHRNPRIIQEFLRQASGKRARNPTRLQKERLYRECIVERGWKQKDIARLLGVSEATVSNWLSHVKTLSEDFPAHRAYEIAHQGPSEADREVSPGRETMPNERADQRSEAGGSAQHGVPTSI